MKNLLILFLLGTATLFAQTTPKINGATLSYNKKTNVMTLTMTDQTFSYPDNSDYDTKIRIVREYDLTMKINGVEYSMTEPYFMTYGARNPMFWSFVTEKPGNCTSVETHGLNYVYKFAKMQKGEYLLIITKRCDEKYVEQTWTTSLVIK